jgi:hypothetical protein
MKGKEFLKPTITKIVFSFVVIIVWIFIARSFGDYFCSVPQSYVNAGCFPHPAYLDYINLVPSHCNCNVTSSDAITSFFINGVIPFILTYLLYSVVSMMLSKKSPKV